MLFMPYLCKTRIDYWQNDIDKIDKKQIGTEPYSYSEGDPRVVSHWVMTNTLSVKWDLSTYEKVTQW